jgi:hypothetical protein
MLSTVHFAFVSCLSFLTSQQDSEALASTRVEHQLPHLGLTVIEERRVDPLTGRVVREARDASGGAVDFDALRAREQTLEIAENGKLSRDLVAHVAALPPDAPVSVVFWLREPAHPDYVELMQSHVAAGIDPQTARQLVLDTARDACAPGNASFAARLRAAGFDVTAIGEFWPDVFTTLPASALRSWASDEAVDLCYYAFTEGGPLQQFAQGTMRTFNVHDAGITGATGPTKVLVNDCGEVNGTHPWLPPVIKGTNHSVSSHASGVAGNICINGGGYTAAAMGLPQLYSYDGCGSDLLAQQAWTWGLSQGIDVGNTSWMNGNNAGSIVFLDRYFDYTIRNFSVMLFAAIGNNGLTGTLTVSPANGYNSVSSGAYNDHDTLDWVDDTMAVYSSWKNPIEGHEKPELVAPGDQCVSTSWPSGTQIFAGTSSASPLTCGVGVLVLNTQPALLASMTTLKAALMVGAWHNVEGSVVLSDKDGAGSVHAAASCALVRDGHYETGTFTAGSFPGNVYDKQIALDRGDETRIIALWFSNPDSAYSTDVLEMDVDLAVLDPNNIVVASSANAFNPFELVQFVPTKTGVYTVRLTKTKFLGTSEPYTIAWSTRQDAAVADVTFTGTPSLGTNLQTNFRSRYDKNVSFLGAVSLYSSPSTIPISAGRVLPLGRDRFALYSLGNNLPTFLSGYWGTLDATGQATGTFKIPNDAHYLGLTFFVSMYTYPSGGGARDTSPAAQFLIQ